METEVKIEAGGETEVKIEAGGGAVTEETVKEEEEVKTEVKVELFGSDGGEVVAEVQVTEQKEGQAEGISLSRCSHVPLVFSF